MQHAIEALSQYHWAKAAGVPVGELEHLHLLGDSLLRRLVLTS